MEFFRARALDFPDPAAGCVARLARTVAWYESPEYQAIMHLRTDNTEGIGVIAEGR
jgi:hypothetical protein